MGIENPVHLLFVAVIALLVLGPRRLPELARTLGKGLREFRAAVDGTMHNSDPHSQPAQLAQTAAAQPAPPEPATVVQQPATAQPAASPQPAAAAPVQPAGQTAAPAGLPAGEPAVESPAVAALPGVPAPLPGEPLDG